MLPLVPRDRSSYGYSPLGLRSPSASLSAPSSKSSLQQQLQASNSSIKPVHVLLTFLLCAILGLQAYHLHAANTISANLQRGTTNFADHNDHVLNAHFSPDYPPALTPPPPAAPLPITTPLAAALSTVSLPPASPEQQSRTPSISSKHPLRASLHPPATDALFPSIYYVYDLSPLNDVILRNYSTIYSGEHPLTFEREDFRHHISELFVESVTRQQSDAQLQHLCAPPGTKLDHRFARSKFTHDPRAATHFIIPAILSIAMHSQALIEEQVVAQLVELLERPIKVPSNPCDPDSPVVEVPSPFLTRHGQDHLLSVSTWDVPKAMGTKRKGQPIKNHAIELARRFEDSTFFNLESTFVNRLRGVFMDFYKNTKTPYDLKAHMTGSPTHFRVVPYVPHFVLDSKLHTLANWQHETRAESAWLTAHADLSASAARETLQMFVSNLASKPKGQWNNEESAFAAQMPTRSNLFTLRCTVFDKGHATRAMLFRMVGEKPLKEFTSSMDQLTNSKEAGQPSKPSSPEEECTTSLLTSDFCLIPAGDSPSSRRLYDAILASCIPVIVSDKIELPFTTILKWQTFSVQLSQKAILDGDASGLIELSTWSIAKKNSYRKALLRVRHHFDWSGHAKEGSATAHDLELHRNMMQPMSNVYKQLYQKEYTTVRDLHGYSTVDLMLLDHQAALIAKERWWQGQQQKAKKQKR